MNVAIVGEKGGGGKTTFATNLAGIRASRVGNGRVSLLDTDRQGSSQFWNEERVGHGNGLSQVEVLGAYGESYRRVMSDRKPSFTDSVADIPPGDSEEQRTALYTADCLIVPVQPGAADIWTLSLLDVRVAQAIEDRPGLRPGLSSTGFRLTREIATGPTRWRPSARRVRRFRWQMPRFPTA